jgi:hypothetical protein
LRRATALAGGAHLLIGGGRTRRYTGLIPKISPLAVLTLALAQRKLNKMARTIPLEAPWTAAQAAEWETATISHGAIDGAVRSGERVAAEILDRG